MSSISRYALLSLVSLALLGVSAYFISMLKTAQAREVEAACKGLQANPKSPAYDVPFPTAAKEFAAQHSSGKPINLSDYRGKVVLVNFWASWCKTCAAEKPSLNELQAELGSDGVAVLALASDPDWQPVKAKLPAGSPLTVLLDPPAEGENVGSVAQAYGVKKVPETFIVDKQGVIRHYIVNKRDWNSEIARTCIAALARE